MVLRRLLRIGRVKKNLKGSVLAASLALISATNALAQQNYWGEDNAHIFHEVPNQAIIEAVQPDRIIQPNEDLNHQNDAELKNLFWQYWKDLEKFKGEAKISFDSLVNSRNAFMETLNKLEHTPANESPKSEEGINNVIDRFAEIYNNFKLTCEQVKGTQSSFLESSLFNLSNDAMFQSDQNPFYATSILTEAANLQKELDSLNSDLNKLQNACIAFEQGIKGKGFEPADDGKYNLAYLLKRDWKFGEEHPKAKQAFLKEFKIIIGKTNVILYTMERIYGIRDNN